MRLSWGWDAVPLRGDGLSCGSISMGVMRQTKHLVLNRNWPIYPRTLIVRNHIPRWRALFFLPLTTNLATLESQRGTRRAPFDLTDQWRKHFLRLRMTGRDGGRDRVRSGRVVSLVFLYLCHSVFDWLHSHRFLYLPVKPLWVFFFLGGGRQSSLPHSHPLPAHSAFSRWHPLPTHLHCVPIMHTDSTSFVWADTHTRAHSNKLTQTWVILRFTDFRDSYCLW